MAQMECSFFCMDLSNFGLIFELWVMMVLIIKLCYKLVIIIVKIVKLDAHRDENNYNEPIIYKHNKYETYYICEIESNCFWTLWITHLFKNIRSISVFNSLSNFILMPNLIFIICNFCELVFISKFLLLLSSINDSRILIWQIFNFNLLSHLILIFIFHILKLIKFIFFSFELTLHFISMFLFLLHLFFPLDLL